MIIQIRPASALDAEAVCKVVRSSITNCCQLDHDDEPTLLLDWLANKTVDNSLRWISNPANHAIVAMLDGEIVGFGLAQGEELMLLYATFEARFRGVGKAMLAALEAHARACNLPRLHLESTKSAEAFYLRNGFVPSGPVEMGFGMPALPMQKILS